MKQAARFANDGIFSVGQAGRGAARFIQPPRLPGKYTLKMSDIKDLVSRNSQTDTSAGAAYYIHPTTGELVTVAAGEVLNHPTLGNVSFDTYKQLCQDSEDPGEWGASLGFPVVATPTGEIFGPFLEQSLTGSTLTAREYFLNSIDSGSPSSIIYFNIRYRVGTSNNIFVLFRDDSTVAESVYSGVIGVATITQNNAGTLVIISDLYNPILGYYELKGSMLFTDPAHVLLLGIGPNSTDNSSILVLGADVSEDRAILDFHVPSSGSNVTIASRAGTTKLADISTDFPKFRDSLGGEVDGVELVDTSLYSAENVTIIESDSFITTAAFGNIYKNSTLQIGEQYNFSATLANVGAGPAGVSSSSTKGGLYFYTDGVASGRFTAIAEKLTLVSAESGTLFSELSVQKISPAAARHSFTWTPGVDYTDHTTVESIMTPSDSDGFLKASAAGGFELSDGTNTLESTGINWEAGTAYPMEIIYGYNEALAAYKMELNVHVDGEWISVIGDFDQYFDIGDPADFILGLENPYQSSVKSHVTEKLSQSHWRPTETIPDGYSTLTSGGEPLTSNDLPITSNDSPIYAIGE